MAERYSGKYSPDKPLRQRRVDAASGRSNVLFIPPVVLAFTSLRHDASGLALALITAAILAGGAFLLREGLRAEAAFNERPVARKPALPRKIIASALCGIGVALAAFSKHGAPVPAVILGVAATGLHLAAFGIDPLSNKRIEGVDEFQQDRVARVVDEAENYLDAMTRAITSVKDRQLQMRVGSFQATVRNLIAKVQADPRDLTAARKFLGVYLMGARDATVRFASLWNQRQDAAAHDAYVALLNDLERQFTAHSDQMLLNDRSALDIEINVLRDRLQREGIRTE